MKLNEMLIVVALVAVVIALFAWAAAKLQNASRPSRRPVIGNINRRFFRQHMRKFYLAPLLIEKMFGWLPGQIAPAGGVQFANIGEGTYPNGRKSFLPDAATASRYLLYKQGTDADHVAVAGAGDASIGNSDDSADVGIPLCINLHNASAGTNRCVTDGTIANGDLMKTGAAGVATKAAARTDAGYFGKASFGTDTTSAANDVISYISDLA